MSEPKSLIPRPPEAGNGAAPYQQGITLEIPASFLQQTRGDAGTEEDSESVPLSQYLWLIWRHKWKVLAFVAFAVITTWIVSSRLTPIYESTAVIDVDRRAPAGIVGQEAQTTNAPNDSDQFLATQVKLIQSDAVLRPVVRKYNPEPPQSSSSLLGQQPTQTVTEEEAPVLLKRLRITRPPNTFILQIAYRHQDPRMAAAVANAVADSYVANTYNIRFRSSAGLSRFLEKQIEELKAKMEKSQAALVAFEREFNVIDPEEKTSILSSRLLQLNTEYTNAQADRVRREAAYNSVKGGSMESGFVSSQGESLNKLQQRLNEAQEKFAQVKTQFGVNHPDYRQAASVVVELQNQLDATRKNIGSRSEIEYREALNREQMIQKALRETKDEVDRLNSKSFQYKSLKQDADSDKKLYEELIHKIRTSEINAGFQNSEIRLADQALPARRPVFPNIPLNLGLALLLSSLLAVGAVILADSFDTTIHDPDQVHRMGTHVIGSLPQVATWRTAQPLLTEVDASSGASSGNGLVAAANALTRRGGNRQASVYDESVRSIREAMMLADIDNPLRSVLITSAMPKEGKSSFASYLAMVNAQQNVKTLLVDADLRRPSAHTRFSMKNDVGLSDVIRKDHDWREVIQPVPGIPNLFLLAAGSSSNRAYDLLGPTLERILESARDDFSLVVLDSPPLLGFAEPLKAASLADGVVVVASSSTTQRAAVQSVLTSLRRVKARVLGIVLNNVDQQYSQKYYYYGYYGKYYSHYYRTDSD